MHDRSAAHLRVDAEAPQARREGLLRGVLKRAYDREELPDGLRLRLEPTANTLSMIARVVEAERRCCRFLRFGITVQPGGGPIVLELTGPRGTREFVAALLEV